MFLYWLPVDFRIQLLVTVLNALRGTSPPYIQDFAKSYVPMRTLRAENSRFLAQPRLRTKQYGDRRLAVSAVVQWKCLQADLRHKNTLKNHLFKLAFIIDIIIHFIDICVHDFWFYIFGYFESTQFFFVLGSLKFNSAILAKQQQNETTQHLHQPYLLSIFNILKGNIIQ